MHTLLQLVFYNIVQFIREEGKMLKPLIFLFLFFCLSFITSRRWPKKIHCCLQISLGKLRCNFVCKHLSFGISFSFFNYLKHMSSIWIFLKKQFFFRFIFVPLICLLWNLLFSNNHAIDLKNLMERQLVLQMLKA